MSRIAEPTTASSPSGFNSLGDSSMDQLLAPSMDDHLAKDYHTLSSAEEKKVDEPTVGENLSYDDNPPVNNSSFERALDEIENEFDAEDDNEFDNDRQESKSDALSDGLVSSTVESRRYNDILGLLRNRRQELTAALQKQPASLAAQSSDDALVEVATKSTDEGDASAVSEERDTKSDEEKLVKKEGSGDSDEKTAAASNLEKKAESSKSDDKTTKECITEDSKANQLEKIEPAPQETEEERRRRQQTTTPTRRHPVDLHSLSPTPPRSPQRSLPYFHKPSGVTPPASPTFLTSLGDKSPPRKARPHLSPKSRSDGSTSPRMSSPARFSPSSSPSARASGALARDLPTLPPLMASRTQQEGSPKSTSHHQPESPQSETGVVTPSAFTIPRSISSPSRKLDIAATAAQNALPRSPPRKGSPFRASGGQPARKPIPPDKIRFRDPYPILRPEKQPRDPKEIIAEYTTPREQDPIRWVRPKPDLKQLIVAAMGTSLARRSNACGALKVLTKSKKNQINLFRTDSFMSSLLYCASQEIPTQERDVALDARTRAVSCIKAVCEPKVNRYHVVTFPGVLDCLAKVIQTDNGESRSLACGALALIAKTSDCREEIAKDFRLAKLLAQVLGNRVPVPSPVKEEKKEDHASSPQTVEHTDEEDDDNSENSGIAGEESTIGDYDTAFAGSVGMLESFDMLSRNNPNSPHPQSDEERTVEDATVTSYESENDQPPVDSIRKMNLERNQKFVQESRANACAVLLHLSRECALSVSVPYDIHRKGVLTWTRPNPFLYCLSLFSVATRL
eukprot:scaffold8471_cov184-Amphora_coffeaeformis.AAC.25